MFVYQEMIKAILVFAALPSIAPQKVLLDYRLSELGRAVSNLYETVFEKP